MNILIFFTKFKKQKRNVKVFCKIEKKTVNFFSFFFNFQIDLIVSTLEKI